MSAPAIAAVGAGRMGRGIGITLACAGQQVLLVDAKERAAADFERLRDEAFADMRGQVEALVDLGLLMDGHRGGGPVQADVVFGEDGLARAIRLAPVSRRIP